MKQLSVRFNDYYRGSESVAIIEALENGVGISFYLGDGGDIGLYVSKEAFEKIKEALIALCNDPAEFLGSGAADIENASFHQAFSPGEPFSDRANSNPMRLIGKNIDFMDLEGNAGIFSVGFSGDFIGFVLTLINDRTVKFLIDTNALKNIIDLMKEIDF